MNIYSETNYKIVLRRTLLERQKIDKSVTFQSLAQAMRVPKSYVSKVIHDKADLSPDQLYLAARYLGLDEEEYEYLDLLLQHAKCSLQKRQQQLLEKVQKIRANKRELENQLSVDNAMDIKLDTTEYYRDPLFQIVHSCLSLPKYQDKPANLAKDLGISLSRMLDVVNSLEKFGLIEKCDDQIKIKVSSLHLPKSAQVFEQWRHQVRFLSMQKMQSLEKKDQYSFSVTISAENDFLDVVRERFGSFLKDMEHQVSNASCEKVFQINFDAHSWI